MFPLSVCIIAKNEEAHIEECLRRLAPYGFEIVLTDTGSTDQTIKIASRYTDRIYHFDWCDDFSAARNFCIEKASHNWILSLDCDEYIEKIDLDALRKCMERHQDAAGRILIRSRFTQDGQTRFEQMRVRRLADRRYFHFLGAVHEQLAYCPDTIVAEMSTTPAEQTSAKKIYDAPVTILHIGYDLSESEMQEKCRRNIALLEAELAKEGPDPYLYYQLGASCRRLKDHEKAFDYFDAGLSLDVDPNLDYVRTMVESYGYTLLDLKRNKEAMGLFQLYDLFAVRADFVFLMGLVYMNNGLFDQAISEFKKAASMDDFAVEGTNSYMANYNIGVIYECTKHITKAKEYYEKCGEYGPAKQRLSEIQKV